MANLELSHSGIAIAQSCWKKYYWKYIEALVPRQESNALTLGKVVHSAFDMFYNGFSSEDVALYINDTFCRQIANVAPEELEPLVVARYTALGCGQTILVRTPQSFRTSSPSSRLRSGLSVGYTSEGELTVSLRSTMRSG